MRKFPLNAARRLGAATRLWRGFPIVCKLFLMLLCLFLNKWLDSLANNQISRIRISDIIVCFFLIPLALLGLSYMFDAGSKGLTVLGSFITAILGLGLIYTVYYCKKKGGQEKCINRFKTREKRRVTMQELPDDMIYLKAKLAALIEHTGLPEDAGMEEIEALTKNQTLDDDATDSDKIEEAEAEQETPDSGNDNDTLEC